MPYMNGSHGEEAQGVDSTPAPLVLPEVDSMSMSLEGCGRGFIPSEATEITEEKRMLPINKTNEFLEEQLENMKEQLPDVKLPDLSEYHQTPAEDSVCFKYADVPKPIGTIVEAMEGDQKPSDALFSEQQAIESKISCSVESNVGTSSGQPSDKEDDLMVCDNLPSPPDEHDYFSIEERQTKAYLPSGECENSGETQQQKPGDFRQDQIITCANEESVDLSYPAESDEAPDAEEIQIYSSVLQDGSGEELHSNYFKTECEEVECDFPDLYTYDIQVNTAQPSNANMANLGYNDASMSTTIGVSEITADPVTYELSPEKYMEIPSMEDITCEQESLHSDAQIFTDGQSPFDEQRISYDGGSSYHDDVPIEEEEEDGGLGQSDREQLANLQPTSALYYATETSTEAQLLTHPCTVQIGEDTKKIIAVSSVSQVEPVHRAVITSNDLFSTSEKVKLLHADHEENIIPSFKDIVEDLERKNVVSHLQQQLQPGHHCVMPQQHVRQSDIVVLNPQTGEVLGTTNPTQPTVTQVKSGGDVILLSGGHGGAPVLNGGGRSGGQSSENKGSGGAGAHRTGRSATDNSGMAAGAGDSGSSPPISGGGLDRVRQVFSMPECQMTNLTVFLDRALVCRRIRPRFNASEITEVLFGHLSPAIDKDSVRVEIRGAATILDVSYFARSLTDGEATWSQTILELKQELRQCQRQAETLVTRINRTEKQRMILDTFADSLSHRDEELAAGLLATVTPAPSGAVANHTGGLPPSGAPTPALSGAEHKGSMELTNPYDPRHMDTLHRFLTVYEEQTERLDATMLDANDELEQVQNRIEVIQRELHDIELRQDEHLTRELSVLVEPRETGQVEMLISYVVGRCSWTPAYDIRIFNSDGTMKIVYYGMVQQATGEDWETKSMMLSTTQPGTGGTVPQLGTQRVHFRRDASPFFTPSGSVLANTHITVPSGGKVRPSSKIGGSRRSTRPTTTSFNEVEGLFNNMDLTQKDTSTPVQTLQRGVSLEAGPHMSFRSTSASNRVLARRTLGASMLFNTPSMTNMQQVGVNSTTRPGQHLSDTCNTTGQLAPGAQTVVATVHLDVPRPPNVIKCDNELVRVTVSLLDLQPRYEYVTVPKRSLHAYLKATAINRSDFSILAGQTNIYADNTFIGKSVIGPVAQGEEFSCHLGAEHGIKVFYRPLCKFREGTGSGGKHATLICKQLIEIRNTFDRSIRLMVVDQVPVSGEDKIKVNLLEPTIKHPEKYDRNKPIRMNKSNNVEWDLDLAAGETKELTLKYSIDHPACEDLDVSVSQT